jgi:WD40 repeat protein
MDRPIIRVFISSPGDVRPERLRALEIVRKLDREFSYHFRVEAVFWEREPVKATEDYQSQISPPRWTDITVVILWSSLGSPLAATFRGPHTQKQPVTGTEWEFEDAFQAWSRTQERPDLYVYLKKQSSDISLASPEQAAEALRRKNQLDAFIAHWFLHPDGTVKGSTTAFRDSTDFEYLLEAHLRENLRRRIQNYNEGQREISWHEPPYCGLSHFELKQASIFFGRTRARNQLRELLAAQATRGCATVLVLGASGSGKSSLVRAGLLYDLSLPGMIGRVAICRNAILRPSSEPKDLLLGLAKALFTARSDVRDPGALPELAASGLTPGTIAASLQRDAEQETPAWQIDAWLDQAYQQIAKQESLAEHAQVRLALVVDQMEELFTLAGVGDAERRRFVQVLDHLARSNRVYVIGTLRSDFFQYLDKVPPLAKLTAEGRYLLPPPDSAELGQMIRGPAREAGCSFEYKPEQGIRLDEVIQEAATRNPESLPLLEFLLDELWKQRSPNGMLSFQVYKDLGELEGAIGKRAEDEFNKLPADVQKTLPRVLRALVTVSQGSEGKVAAAPVVLAKFRDDPAAHQLVSAFLDSRVRLLTADAAHIRVTHEALLSHWPRAKQQIEQDRIDLQARGRLKDSHLRWKESGRREDLLLPVGLPLSEAQDQLTRRGSELDRELCEYVETSTDYADRQRLRRTRFITAVAVAMTVLGIGASIGAYFAHQNAVRVSRQAAQTARRDATDRFLRDPGTALAYIARAIRFDPDNAGIRTSALLLLSGLVWDSLPAAAMNHPAPVSSAEFSHDGTKVLTVAGDTARIWTVGKTQKPQQVLSHGDSIISAEFSSDDMLVLTAGNDGTVRVWRTATGELVTKLANFKKPVELDQVHFAPDSRKVLTITRDRPHSCSSGEGKEDCLVTVWDIATNQPIGAPLRHPLDVRTAEFTADGRRILSAADDDVARVWDLESGRLLSEISHHGVINAAHADAAGTRVITASDDGTARIADAVSGTTIAILRHEDRVFDARFSPDGRWAATASQDGSARLWDAATGLLLCAPMRHDAAVRSVSFAAGSSRLVTVASDFSVRIWDSRACRQIGAALHHTSAVHSAAMSRDGKLVLTASEDGKARLWSALANPDEGRLVGTDRGLYTARFSPDVRRIAVGAGDNSARIWDLASRQLVGKEMKHRGPVYSVAFSPDGKYLITGSSDFSARVWRADDGSPIGGVPRIPRDCDKDPPPEPEPEPGAYTSCGEVYGVGFSPDGNSVFSASSDGKVRIWDWKTGLLQGSMEFRFNNGRDPVRSAAYSPDGTRIAMGTEHGIAQVWDATTRSAVTGQMHHQNRIWSIQFSRDGKRLVTASQDGTAIVWDAGTGARVGSPMVHGGAVLSAVFSPDDNFILTASNDGAIRLWDSTTGQLLGHLTREQGALHDAEFDPTGDRVLAAGMNGPAHIWFVPRIEASRAEGLAQLAELVGGQVVSADGTIQEMSNRQARVAEAEKGLQGPGQKADDELGRRTRALVQAAEAAPEGARGPAEPATVPDEVRLDFDSEDAAVAESGIPAESYLARYGITLREVTRGSTVSITDYIQWYGGQAVQPWSGSNALTQTRRGDQIAFTLVFDRPLTSFGFTRPGLLATSESGIVFPAWTAHALDEAGHEIPQTGDSSRPCAPEDHHGWPAMGLSDGIGEPMFGCYEFVPPRTFVLHGPGIHAVRFDSDNHHFAGFGAVVLDDLVLRRSSQSR